MYAVYVYVKLTFNGSFHGGDQLESNSQNQSIEAEIIGSTEVFEHPFPIIGPVGGRSAGANGIVLCYIVKFDARNRKIAFLSR